MNPFELSIMIVSHGHENELPECVNSLPLACEGLRTEILLLDNLGRSLQNMFCNSSSDNLRIHNNLRPLGFAANVNILAAQAQGRFLLVLNPDTQHLAGKISSAIDTLINNRNAAVVGSKLVNSDLTFQPSYRRFPTVPVLVCRATGVEHWKSRPKFYRYRVMDGEQFFEPTAVDWVFGAFMLVEGSRFKELGGMDTKFRMYYEDVDLCYRFRQRGAATIYDPSVTFIHRHARESARQPFSKIRRWHLLSGIRYFSKHRYFFYPPKHVGCEASR